MTGWQRENIMQLEDSARAYGMPDGMEARFARDALGCRQSGLSFQRLGPGVRQPFGHRHAEEEEIYVVVEGTGRIRLDDEVVQLSTWDAVRIAPEVARALEGGPAGIAVLAFGARGMGIADVEPLQDWWAESS